MRQILWLEDEGESEERIWVHLLEARMNPSKLPATKESPAKVRN